MKIHQKNQENMAKLEISLQHLDNSGFVSIRLSNSYKLCVHLN